MGILDSIMTPVSQADDPLAEREKWLQMSQLFNSFTMNPQASQGYYDSQQRGIERQRDAIALKSGKEAAATKANATYAALESAGISPEVLALAKINPALGKTITTDFIKAKMGSGYMSKFSGVQTDPVSGQQFVIRSDPNTNKSERINIEGAIAQTPQGKITMESVARLKEADIAKATDVGQKAFGRAGAIDESLTKLESAREAVNNGASSGFLAKFVPSFNAATTQLRAAANQLGIDIINSATFGALSEKELQLALSTGLDLSLQGEELKNHIADKINAQTKLRNELVKQAKVLTKGDITYSAYIQQYGSSGAREVPVQNYQTPQNAGSGATGTGGYTLSADQIKKMTPEQKAKFTSLTGIRLP